MPSMKIKFVAWVVEPGIHGLDHPLNVGSRDIGVMIGRAAQRCSWDRPCVSAIWQRGSPQWSTPHPLLPGHRGIAECSPLWAATRFSSGSARLRSAAPRAERCADVSLSEAPLPQLGIAISSDPITHT